MLLKKGRVGRAGESRKVFMTPLYLAIRHGQVVLALKLMEQNASIYRHGRWPGYLLEALMQAVARLPATLANERDVPMGRLRRCHDAAARNMGALPRLVGDLIRLEFDPSQSTGLTSWCSGFDILPEGLLDDRVQRCSARNELAQVRRARKWELGRP